jgi:hypothetical protein
MYIHIFTQRTINDLLQSKWVMGKYVPCYHKKKETYDFQMSDLQILVCTSKLNDFE